MPSIIGILSLKGGDGAAQVLPKNSDDHQENNSADNKQLPEGLQKTSSDSELQEGEETTAPKVVAKTLHLSDDATNTTKPNGGNKPTGKDEDHDSGTTSNTSMNGDTTTTTATPAVVVSAQEDDDDDDDDIIPAVQEESDDDDDSQDTNTAEEVKNEDFTTPGLRWYNPIRRFCGRIVNDDMFQVFIVILIILNAAMMGIGTYDFVEDNPKIQRAFDMADRAFLIIFTIESALQIGYWGYQLFQDGWLTFDLLVVLGSWTLEEVQVFRAIRVFRAFRLVARLAVLKDLVNAIVAVLPRIGSIMLLFMLVLYIYAVLCTVLYAKGDYEENYFGRLDYSLFTLFQFVTLENWGEISREVKAVHPSFAYIVLSFLTVSSFILYSLVVAVVCDAVAVVEHPDIALRNFEEQMKKERSKTKKRVFKLTAHLDDLSQQQMEILTSVQSTLMKYKSFRDDAKDSQMQAAELMASYHDFDT